MKNEAEAAPERAEPGHPSAERINAFIIDDDSLMAGLLARRLERRDVEPRVFDDGERLLGALANGTPAILFSDLEMPRMKGARLISRARERGYGGTIVLLTASRDHAAISEALRSGADMVLAKPPREYDLDWLVAKARLTFPAPVLLDPVREMLEHVDQGIVVVDEECVPLCVNARARRMLSVNGVADAVEALERSGIASEIMKARAGDISFVEAPGAAAMRGAPFGLEVHELAAGSRRLRLVLLHDFSERRRLDELHARFAAYLSHRMRTPLTAVRNAVTILCGAEAPPEAAERERFLEIGCRNIEKLVSCLDGLQRAFLAESREASGCRSLARVGAEVSAALAEAERSGVISGFRLQSPETLAVVSRARLAEFVRSAASAMANRLGAAPRIECVVAAHEGSAEYGGGDPEISIVLSSKARSAMSVVSLEEYLAGGDSEAGLALERLARAMGGALSFPERETIRLAIPGEPPYDRELDLVLPLHLVLERAQMSNAEFNLVTVRAVGARETDRHACRTIAGFLHGCFAGGEALVSRGKSSSCFNVFAAGMAVARIDAAMEHMRERFAHACHERGDEIYPSIRWEIAYHRDADSRDDAGVRDLVETYLP